ncbi:transcription elongation factor [Cryptosporidium sp. chipmunk genotype I]|uniref:transcription elongation factor n=1 Tax=Cryptosporidium sp. chipmunk genotype I TaxID=1280935 RepID=UPI00351A4C7D|nr:transcription elongation factor [Cryptosporidium sp. chipmunk genotype I]
MEQESRNSRERGSDTNGATEKVFVSLKESGSQGLDVFDANEVNGEIYIENKDELVGNTSKNELEYTQDDSTKILSSSDKLAENTRAQRPKKKKRRQQGSIIGGGSLQALLHPGTSDDHYSRSDSSEVSDESRTEKRNRKRKSSGSKSHKKSREKYKMYIHDEAEEDDEDVDDNTIEGSQERPSRRKRDSRSSSEDEDEDDEEGYDELKDFIADEVEEDGIDDSLVYRGSHILSQSTGKVEGDLIATNGRSEVGHESSEDDDDDEILRGGLEEDDLALIEENTGIRLNKDSQKHRLKKVSETLDSPDKTLVGKDIGDLEDLLFNASADQEEDSLYKPRNFDPASGFDSENSEDADDWMVDDMDEKGFRGDEFNMIQSVFGDYDTVMDILMNKTSKNKDLPDSSMLDSESANNAKLPKASEEFDTEKTIIGGDHEIDMVDDMDEELFGEATEREEGEVENIQDKMKKTTLQTLHSISEPAQLQGQFLTDFDGEVKYADIPERLYLLYGSRWKSLKERKISKEELQQEAVWISRKFLQTYPELFKEELLRRSHNLEFKTSFPYVSSGGVIQVVSNAVFLVLDWILNERLDVPYISLHKMHLIQPPLNDFLLGKIVFLDSIYYKLKLSVENFQQRLLAIREKKSVSDIFRLAESHELPEDHIIQALLSVSGLQETLQSSYYFDSSRDIDNIRSYFLYHIDTPRFKQIEEASIGDSSNVSKSTELGKATLRHLSRKQRRNYMIELFEYIETNELFKLWSPYIVSPYVLSLYLKSFTSPQFHCSTPTGVIPGIPNTFSLLPPGGPVLENSKTALYKWLEKLVRQDNPMFSTSEKILDSLIVYEARRLASFPAIRAKVFEYFLSNACITTVTTTKGEKSLSPNGVFWLARRLFRKPVNTLLPGTYLPLNDDLGSDAQSSNSNTLFDGCLCSEVLELERRGLIELIVHPLCIDDPAPWRGSDGEARIKERFLHEVGLLESGMESNSLQKGSLPAPIMNRFDQEFRMYVNSDNIDNRIVRNILDELKYGYVSISGSIWSKLVQIPILHRLIEKELFPSFRTEVINYLKMRSQEYIAELCSLNLQKRLRVLPPRHPVRDEQIAETQAGRSGEHHRGERSKGNDKYESEEDEFDDDYSGNAIDSDNENFVSRRSRNSRWRGASGNHFNGIREEYNTNWGLNIISCVVEKAQNGFKVCVVSLDIFGELRDFLVMDHLLSNISHRNSRHIDSKYSDKGDSSGTLESQRFDEDMENLIRFTKMYYPHYICVGISDRKSLELASIWNHILKKVKRKDQKFTPGFLFVSMDVSRALVRRSGSGQKVTGTQKPKGLQSEYPMYVNLAVSVGRLVQNPLAEHLQLWEDSGNEIESELSTNTLSLDNELGIANSSSSTGAKDWFNPITCLKLHRLQDSVDPKMLQFHLLLAIRSVVANLGVQINRMKGHSHLQSPLKFVSGLGPRKAKSLAFYLDSHPGPISTRNQLKQDDHHSETLNRKATSADNDRYEYDFKQGEQQQDGCLTRNVYLNAQVFLRVDEESCNEKEYNRNLNIFDISRLSDEDDKELVLTILGNIRDQISEENVSGNRQKSKEKDETILWTWISKRSSKLETLDLEAYAKLMYENQDRPRLLPYLNRMLRELKKPYDCTFVSREFRGVEKSRQLRESLEISKEDLFIGCEITCRITGVLNNVRGPSRSPITLWFDQYNMKVVLEDFDSLWEELLDEFPKLQSASLDALFKVNTPLQAIVTNIDFSQHCVFVTLSQSKVCNILNYLIDGVWRQQQYRLDMIEKHRYENTSGGSSHSQVGQINNNTDSSSTSMTNVAIQEYQRNDFNLLKDDLSALIWTDIRHFAFILFKKNLNVLFTSSGLNLNSGLCKNISGPGDRLWDRDGRGDGKYHGTILRTIHHPNFRSWTHEQIIEYMKTDTVPLGEVIIKSSTKYIDKLNMYVKVCENPFMFKVINIDEFDQRLPGELGRRLRIDDSDFNDIDQILIQYVHPLKVHLSNVFSHPKYRSNMEYQNLVTELLVESSTSGNSIVWGITADRQIPCRFHLISVPPNSRVGSSGARIHFEDGIYVNHKGFQLWRKSDNTLRKLLNWWKTDGFFKRSKHLEDYKRYKEYMVRQKQGKASSEDDFVSRKFGVSHHNSSYHYNSGGAGSGNGGGGGYQSQHSSNYSHSKHHHPPESFGGQSGGSHSKSGGGAPQYGSYSHSHSHSHSGGSRKSFHGYPLPQMEGGSAHHYPPPVAETYESSLPGNYRYSRR